MNASTTTLSPSVQTTQPRLQQRLKKLLRNSPHLALHNARSDSRPELEDYIRGTFAKAYDADIQVFAPLLLELRCAGSISGVAGIRPAANTSLFVEHYLDNPVEQCISQFTGVDTRRDQIAEVCNLAALRPGACQLITVMLAASLYAAGYRYGILAGTTQLEKILTKQNFSLRTLCAADPARLGDQLDQWGTYYETEPKVLVVDIKKTVETLHAHLLPAAILNFLDDRTISLGHTLASTRFIGDRFATAA